MTVDKLIALVEAGFTKDEIIKLTERETAAPKFDVTNSETPKAETAKEEPKTEPAKEEVKTEPEAAINAAIEKALKPFEELYNNMAKLAVMPSLENVEPKGVEDIVDKFFKGE